MLFQDVLCFCQIYLLEGYHLSTQTRLLQQTTQSEGLSDTTKAYGAVFVGLMVASFAAVLMRAALDEGIPAILIAGARIFIAWLVLTPLVASRYRDELRKLRRRDILLASVAGVVMCLHFALMAFSLMYVKVAISQVLVNSIPLWAALLETFVLRTTLPRPVWIGLALAVAGGTLIASASLGGGSTLIIAPDAVAISANGSGNPMLGIGLALTSAIFASMYLIIGRKVRARLSLIPYVWMLYGSGGFVGMTAVLLTGTPVTGHSSLGILWILLIAFGPQLVSHSAFNFALAHIPATIVSISGQFVTVTSVIVAALIFFEYPSPLEVVGMAMIMLGVVSAILGQRQRAT